MSEDQVMSIFALLDLETQEKRNRFLQFETVRPKTEQTFEVIVSDHSLPLTKES